MSLYGIASVFKITKKDKSYSFQSATKDIKLMQETAVHASDHIVRQESTILWGKQNPYAPLGIVKDHQ